MVVEEEFTLGDIVNLYQALSSVNLKGVKIAYALAFLKKQFETHVETVRQSVKVPEGWEEFLQKQIEILNKYKSDKGVPVAVEGATVTVPPDSLPKIREELNQLRNSYKSLLEEKRKYDKELNQLLSSKVGIKVFKVKLEDLPEDIDTNTMEILLSCRIINTEGES